MVKTSHRRSDAGAGAYPAAVGSVGAERHSNGGESHNIWSGTPCRRGRTTFFFAAPRMGIKRIVLPRFHFERHLLEVSDHIKAELDFIPVNCIGKMLLNTLVHERCKRLRTGKRSRCSSLHSGQAELMGLPHDDPWLLKLDSERAERPKRTYCQVTQRVTPTSSRRLVIQQALF